MNVLSALAIALCALYIGGGVLSQHLTAQAAVEAEAKRSIRVAADDARMAADCAAGRTTFVLYYKGQYCGKGE